MCARVTKEREEWIKIKGIAETRLAGVERDNQQHSEHIAALKADKDALETGLYESQQLCSQLEARKEQLEGENQELIVKKEALQQEMARTRQEADTGAGKLERSKDALAAKLLQREKDRQLAP